MATVRSHRFLGDARRSLKTTRNLFGKLLLLALLQFVPILGQIVALGYFLGWAREAAWGMETPLPAHVFGRGDPDFWGRGAKAFIVCLLYSLIMCAFLCILGVVVGVVSIGFHLDETGLFVMTVVDVAVSLVVVLLMAYLMVAGLMRLAIYNRFGAAFQWGASFTMLGREFGGMVKLFWTYVLLGVLLCIPALLVAAAQLPGVLLTMLDDILAFVSNTPVHEMHTALDDAFLVLCAAAFVAQLLLNVVVLLVEALLWRAVGNWVALFDVASWGGRFDPLPFERDRMLEHAAPAPVGLNTAGAVQDGEASVLEVVQVEQVDVVVTPAPEPVPDYTKRCHPLLVSILSILVAVGVSAGASALVVDAFERTHGEELTVERVEQYAEDALEEIEKMYDEIYDEWSRSGGSTHLGDARVVFA